LFKTHKLLKKKTWLAPTALTMQFHWNMYSIHGTYYLQPVDSVSSMDQWTIVHSFHWPFASLH